MWMLPIEAQTRRATAVTQHAPEPARFDNPTPEQLAQHSAEWVKQWTRVVLK